MKKLIGLLTAVFSGTAYAQPAVYGGSGLVVSPIGGMAVYSITDIVLLIIQFILDIVLVLAVLAVVIAGVYLITSGGDEGQKDKAKNIIFYAAIGIVVILLARVIVVFVNSIF